MSKVWLDLAADLLAYTNDQYGSSLRLTAVVFGSARKDRERALTAVKNAVRRGSPVLICFGGLLNHFSVVCGFSEQRLYLFDSSALRWVQLYNVGVGEHSRRTHWIAPETTVAVLDDW